MAEYAVTRQVRMRMVEPAPAYRLTVWCYDPTEPYSVHVLFQQPNQDPVVWTFARDLLAGGLHVPAGTGDVRVFPYRGEVAVVLESPDGRMFFTAEFAELETFLAATYQVVPKGREGEHLDVDAVLARVLEEAETC